MYRKEVNAQSPLRILEESIHGGLGKGNLGVVVAPAGVGKTACLVQIGLDELMREKGVLHVAIGQTVEHVSAWYDALFDDLAAQTRLQDVAGARQVVASHRMIKTFADGSFTPQRLEEAVELCEKHLKLSLAAILVDGFDWAGPDAHGALKAMKAAARKRGVELWMTATSPRGYSPSQPLSALPPCDSCASLIEVAILLVPKGGHVEVVLLKDHGDATPPATHLELHADTLRLVAQGEQRTSKTVPAASFTLLSGGAPGAEAHFGACAEKWGLAEVNYTFAGRGSMRARGLVELTEQELEQGDVSTAYMEAHMHRTYPKTPLFGRVLQSIWHQVNTAGEVFSVGQLLPDGTMKGGTGWAVELARHWGKRVHVFDQERTTWFSWLDGQWAPSVPAITRERFTGTGTRFLNEAGKKAIEELFERSFGQPGAAR